MNTHTDIKEKVASSTSLKLPFPHQAKTFLFMFSIAEKQVRVTTTLHRKVDAEMCIIVKVCCHSCDVVMSQNLSAYFSM